LLSWKELKERRLVQIVVSYAVAGWVVLSIFGEVIDRGVLPEILYRILLVLYFGGMVAATITGWFHGEKGHQKVTRLEVVLLTIVGLLTLGATAQTVRGHLRQNALRAAGEAAGSSLNNLAVLYFRDRSRGEDLTHIADGLTESLIDRLSRSQALTVLTENASELYRDSDLPLDSIAQALEVGTIVDGTVEGRRDRLRVEVFLVDGMSGAEIQRETIERPLDDLLQLEDALAEEVALLLGRWLAAEVEVRAARRGTEDVLAWTLFQRGEKRREAGQEAFLEEDPDLFSEEYRAADSLYAEAERADPDWAVPLVQRGLLSDLLAQVAIGNDPGQALSWLNAGIQYVDRALGSDPRNADAYLVRGKLAYMKWRMGLLADLRESDQVFQQALADLGEARELDPTLAEAWSILSLLHSEEADNTTAKLAAQRAYEADEFLQSADEVLFRLYATSYDLGQFRDATKYCDEGRTRFPRHLLFRECRLWLMAAPSSQAPAADPDEAWRLLESYLNVAPESWEEYLRLKGQILVAGALAKAELADSARSVLSRSQAPPDLDPEMELLGLEALVRLHMGMKDEALELVRTYLTANPQHREGWQWTAHWWWRPLQEEPEFRALVEG
jgi:serine/threonine-protein kinase